MYRSSREIQDQLGKMSTSIQEDLAGISVVKLYGMEERRHRLFRALNDEYLARSLRLPMIVAAHDALAHIQDDDLILIDGEHAPNDYTTFITQLQALKDSESAPVVRPQWFDPVVIKRLLDIGFFNFLIPFIETEEMAKNAVASTRYPPAGKRGIGTAHRSNKFGYMTDYFDRINDDICVTVQIESTRAVENVDAIAAVEGIDALFIGPSDLSAGMGHFLQPTHPEVQKGIARILVPAGAVDPGIMGPLATEENVEFLLREFKKALAAEGYRA